MDVVSREELYAKVWARPMTDVAAEYGITGTALKKTCNRHRVPTPPRGYWAKVQRGKPAKKLDLPKFGTPNLKTIRLATHRAANLPDEVRHAREKAKKLLEERMLTSSDAINASHSEGQQQREVKELVATNPAVSKAKPDRLGFISVNGPGLVSLKIGHASSARALMMLNNLLIFAETQHYKPHATEKGFALVVDEEMIEFGLQERDQNVPHVPTAAELKERERRSKWGDTRLPWPQYDHVPSGRLSIVIDANPYSGLRRTYSDQKNVSLRRRYQR